MRGLFLFLHENRCEDPASPTIVHRPARRAVLISAAGIAVRKSGHISVKHVLLTHTVTCLYDPIRSHEQVVTTVAADFGHE